MSDDFRENIRRNRAMAHDLRHIREPAGLVAAIADLPEFVGITVDEEQCGWLDEHLRKRYAFDPTRARARSPVDDMCAIPIGYDGAFLRRYVAIEKAAAGT